MFLMLLACVLTDEDVRMAFDPDGDGVGAPDDCAPLDATAYPGAEEIWYDGVDQDCDGRSDVDQDGDGSPIGIDCDDSDAQVYPGAEEIWYDGVDQDCDGGNDYDQDGDGSPNDIDCDDSDARVVPGAEEVCGDGVVNGCEMTEDEARAMCRLQGEMSLAEADLKIVGENTGEYVAESVAGGGDVDGDGRSDLLVGAPEHSSGGAKVGAGYLLLSSGALSRHETILSLGAADATHRGEQEWSEAGWSVAMIGDINGDGRAEWAVGERNYWGVGPDSGALFVHLSSEGSEPESSGVAETTLRWTGEAAGDHFGSSAAAAGDVDGGGLADLIVGAYTHDGSAENSGAAYLLLSDGALAVRDGRSDVIVADCKMLGVAANDSAGGSVAGAGDVDGDGLADLLVGASAQDSRGLDSGAAYLLRSTQTFNPRCGVMSLADADLTILGESEGDRAGQSVAGGGDINDDGYGDIIVGAYANDGGGTNAGAAYLLLFKGALGATGMTLDLSDADLKMTGERAGDYAGFSVSIGPDLDGDKRPDVLVGAIYEASVAQKAGASYLLFNDGALASGSSVLSLSDADLKLTGEAYWDYAGVVVTGAGDVNGDGIGELFIGSHHFGVDGPDGPDGADGAAYLLYGRSF
jgi:hypothetical protein